MQDPHDDHALDNQDAYSWLKSMFWDLCNAIECTDIKEESIQEVQPFFDQKYCHAIAHSRKECGESTDWLGQKFSMLPPVSKNVRHMGPNILAKQLLQIYL